MHFKEICKECEVVMNQCRCPSKDKEIRYGICQKCKNSKNNMEKSTVDNSNELEADFLTINLSEDNIERINKFYLNRLEILCGLMAIENRLCDTTGEGVVEEFGFKGNRAEVLAQLANELLFHKSTPYVMEDKPILIERSLRFSLYLKAQEENPTKRRMRDLFLENWGKSDPEAETLLENLQSQYFKSKDNMHNDKECVCYQNN